MVCQVCTPDPPTILISRVRVSCACGFYAQVLGTVRLELERAWDAMLVALVCARCCSWGFNLLVTRALFVALSAGLATGVRDPLAVFFDQRGGG